jgi:hypothetical protein
LGAEIPLGGIQFGNIIFTVIVEGFPALGALPPEFQGTDAPGRAVPEDSGLVPGDKFPLPVVPGFRKGGSGFKEQNKIPTALPVYPYRTCIAGEQKIFGKINDPGTPGGFGGKTLNTARRGIISLNLDKWSVEKKGEFPEPALGIAVEVEGFRTGTEDYGQGPPGNGGKGVRGKVFGPVGPPEQVPGGNYLQQRAQGHGRKGLFRPGFRGKGDRRRILTGYGEKGKKNRQSQRHSPEFHEPSIAKKTGAGQVTKPFAAKP